MGKKYFIMLAVPALLTLMTFVPAMAATTGKISGKVVDAQTGDPLPGANIIIVDTNYGAAADIDGNYFIINVPPGRYDLEAKMMGYGAVKMEAVQVRTNSTTTTNFKLSTQVIEGETIVVTVDAISVKRDQTSSIRNVSSDQIDMLPVESVQQVLNLQAGVVNGHFRGGRINEVSYMMVDAHYGLTIGGGFKYILMRNMAIRIDYAYRDIGLLGKMHSYSLSVLY